jgi:hypothetical protein
MSRNLNDRSVQDVALKTGIYLFAEPLTKNPPSMSHTACLSLLDL